MYIHSDEGLEEIEDCWVLRDAGYNCIWASEMLYKAGQLQAESVIAVIKVSQFLFVCVHPRIVNTVARQLP
jgi:hypothetical protein